MTITFGSTESLQQDYAALMLCKENPQRGFAMLYRKYIDPIHAYIRRRVNDDDTAFDLTSKVFLDAFEKIPTFQWQGKSFAAYLYKIASREVIDTYRRQARRPQTELEEHHAVTQGTSAEVDVKISVERVEKMLAKIKPEYRTVIDLKYFAELSIPEIAEALGISTNNASVRLHRAMAEIKKHLTA